MEATYLTSAQKAEQLPQFDLPEVAFIGRSNCGKSSLINALTARKQLARKSATPGRTQMVNFFRLKRSAESQLILADLPGYGYNVASREIRELWDALITTYLDRPNIRYFCALFDARREFEQFELEFLRDLALRKPLVVIGTKTDKLSQQEVMRATSRWEEALSRFGVNASAVFPISNLKNSGVDALRDFLFTEKT